MQINKKIIRVVAIYMCLALFTSFIINYVNAETTEEKFPFTMFAASDDDGAITVHAGNFCVNGNIATNGTIVSDGNTNISGTKEENLYEHIIYIFDKIDEKYFLGKNVDEHFEDYYKEDININISNPLEVMGITELTGNISINASIKSFNDIKLYGEVKNTNNSVLFSKYGDIIIDSQNVNLNGLIYAPFGDVSIKAQNLNLNNVIVIANHITLECSSVNVNYSNEVAQFVGNTTEFLNIPQYEWEYMEDEDESGLPDFFEDMFNWGLMEDTDGDTLPDVIEIWIGSDPELPDTDGDGLTDAYEYFVCFTDLTKIDTDDNDIVDGEEDLDGDGLTNIQECQNGTHPLIEDTDGDDLSDSEEVNSYLTDSNEKDTDGDGAEDGWEVKNGFDPKVYNASFVVSAEAEGDNVKASVSLRVSGRQVASLMVKKADDIILIDDSIPGYIGSPFRFEIDGEFEQATLSFTFDSALLNSKGFEPAIYYYNEETQLFEELPTTVKGNVASAVTTHFSVYILLNKVTYEDAIKTVLAPGGDVPETRIAFTVDVSGSMAGENIQTAKKVIENFARNLPYDGTVRTGLISFNSTATVFRDLSANHLNVIRVLDLLDCNGGTAIYTGLNAAINILKPKFPNDIYYNAIILLSDGEDDPPVNSYMYQHCIDLANEANISIYAVSIGVKSNQLLVKLAKETGGKYYYADDASGLYEIYREIKDEVEDYTTDSNNDGISDYYTKLLCDETLRVGPYSNMFKSVSYEEFNENDDFDGDGIPNGQEIKIIQCKLTGRVYAFMTSNPVELDSDCDGMVDSIDSKPMDSNRGIVVYETKDNYRDLKDSYFENRPEDFQYGDKTMKELVSMKNIDKSDFNEKKTVLYYKGEWSLLMQILTAGDFSGQMYNVAMDMIDHFMEGTEADYYNETLNKFIDENEESDRYAKAVSEVINQYIREHDGDISGLVYDKIKRGMNYMDEHVSDIEGLKYDEVFSGLGACVDRVYGTSVEMVSYYCDRETYIYTLRFDLCDIFGLDSADIEKNGALKNTFKFGYLAGFRSWYILQHYDAYEGKYKPYINLMSFERVYSGKLK